MHNCSSEIFTVFSFLRSLSQTCSFVRVYYLKEPPEQTPKHLAVCSLPFNGYGNNRWWLVTGDLHIFSKKGFPLALHLETELRTSPQQTAVVVSTGNRYKGFTQVWGWRRESREWFYVDLIFIDVWFLDFGFFMPWSNMNPEGFLLKMHFGENKAPLVPFLHLTSQNPFLQQVTIPVYCSGLKRESPPSCPITWTKPQTFTLPKLLPQSIHVRHLLESSATCHQEHIATSFLPPLPHCNKLAKPVSSRPQLVYFSFTLCPSHTVI